MISYFGLGLHPVSAHPLSFSSVARCTAVPLYRAVSLLYSLQLRYSYSYSLAPVFAVRLPADYGSEDTAPAPFLRLSPNESL